MLADCQAYHSSLSPNTTPSLLRAPTPFAGSLERTEGPREGQAHGEETHIS